MHRSITLSLFVLLLILTDSSLFSQTATRLWSTMYNVDYFIPKQTGFSGDSKIYAIGDNSGKVSIYDAATGTLLDSYKQHDAQVNCTLFDPKSTVLASADKTGHIVLYDYAKKEVQRKISAHKESINTLCYSCNGAYLYSGSKDNTIWLWNMVDKYDDRLVGRLDKGVLTLKVSDDNKTMVVGTSAVYNSLMYYQIPLFLWNNTIEAANVRQVDISPDLKYVATGQLEKVVSVWDLKTGNLAFELKGHKKNAQGVAFSPDGQILASCSDDRTVILWNLNTHEAIYTLQGDKIFDAVVFSPDGKYMATLDEGCKLTMWDVSSLLKTVPLSRQHPLCSDEELVKKAKAKLGTSENIYLPLTTKSQDVVPFDRDNNYYLTTKIGPFTWMSENLKTSVFSNGDPIPTCSSVDEFLKMTTPAYIDYNLVKEPAIIQVYGRLYNYYAVTDTRNVCPDGWHVANEIEWMGLTRELGDPETNGGKLKEVSTLWLGENIGATDELKFKALPAGMVTQEDLFAGRGQLGCWWSVYSNTTDPGKAKVYALSGNKPGLLKGEFNKSDGASVRCVKDADK